MNNMTMVYVILLSKIRSSPDHTFNGPVNEEILGTQRLLMMASFDNL